MPMALLELYINTKKEQEIRLMAHIQQSESLKVFQTVSGKQLFFIIHFV